MVAMVASASGYGTLRRFLSVPEGQPSPGQAGVPGASVSVSSKQRASIKWLLSKAFNNRVPENLQEPFYRDHEDQEHLKPPILGGLANAELYCRTLANMYSDPNYHSLNHWNILQTLARKGVHVADPADCALTETALIQTNPLKMGAHMAVMEALMVLYAREVVTLDRVSAAAQRFGTSQPPRAGSNIPHEDGLLCWINSACAALNHAEEDTTQHVPQVKTLQDLCDGTALAALISFYCPESLPVSRVRVGRMSSIQDCLHNLRLVQQFCHTCLPHNVFHMLPEDVTYMRGSMRQNLIAMLADLFNLLEVHPVQSVKYPGSERGESNEHGVRHKDARCLPPPPPQPIPDLRPDIDSPLQAPFTVPRSPSACAVRPRAPAARSACSTPERRSCSPQRDQSQFVVHRGRGVTTLSSMARRDDDNVSADAPMTAAGRPSHYGDAHNSYAGRRSRRSSITDDSQLTVENFGGSQDRLHFAGRNPEKELATLATARKISAPSVPARTLHTPDPSGDTHHQSGHNNGRSRRSSVSDDSQLTLENFGGHQDRLHFAGRNPEKELATLATHTLATARNKQPSEPSTPVGEPNGRSTGRRSRRSSISDESQLTLENFGGFQDRLHFAGKNPEKELATLATARKMSAPSGPVDTYNPPLRSSRQDGRGSIQFFHGDFQNGAQDSPRPPIERQNSQPQQENYYPIKRQLSSDTITLNKNYFSNKGGGDGGFFLNRDTTDGDGGKMSFAELNKFRNGDQQGLQSPFGQSDVEPQIDRRKTTSFSTPPPNTTTWQQQFMQQESQPNGDDNLNSDDGASGGAMAAQLNNIRLKLEEKRRRIEQEKRRMEVAVSRQRQQLGQQAFLQAVTRGKGARTPAEEAAEERGEGHAPAQEMPLDHPNTTVDTVALEQYQQSIAKMNSNLQDIQSDIARLSTQQSQLQQQQQTQLQQQQQTALQQQQSQLQQQLAQLQQQQLQTKQWAPQQPQPFQQLVQPSLPQLHSQFSSQHNVSRQGPNFGSTPHIPTTPHFQPPYPQYETEPQYRDVNYGTEYGSPGQFYLHEGQQLVQPAQPQRRTWAQHAQLQHENTELRGWQLHQQQQQQQQQQQPPQQQQQQQHQQQPTHQYQQQRDPPPDRGWNPQGFVLHDRTNQQPTQVHYNKDRYENGHEDREQNHLSYTVINPQQYSQSTPLASPQRRAKTPQRQPSVETPRRPESVSLQQLKTPTQPPPDDMEPQNISFIGSAEEDALRQGINRLNISSGTRTYRIPSPTRPSLNRNSFQQLEQEDEQNEKGFYISFDNEAPKRPKPPLRVKRMSPKKERSQTEFHSPERRSPEPQWNDRLPQDEPPFTVHRASNLDTQRENDFRPNDMGRPVDTPRQRPAAEPAALVIGEMNPDPPAQMLQNSAEEMERKKERIMLLSLQRRQRAEEARARAEAAAAARKAREEHVQEQKQARKEEQARRREIILQQYKLKKAVEEAEREGKTLDKTEYYESIRAAGGAPPAQTAPPSGARLRQRAAGGKARPKTIHVDSGALQAAEGLLGSKQPSSTNLTGVSTMRRDYYRGSQDSLAERAGLYRDSPVDDRGGMSPSSGSSGPLGRRGSCKTSRERVNEVEPQATRGRSKYTTYQSNFKAGRKSSSLMNLCDSGLGRATPPRRAPSPGVRALASPAGSGPGSLPGGIGKRRQQSDDNSDASSQHSSIMDYSGPRLYKQPTTKSNRGIMLNAVEYCVFPGAVNAEAKRRVLEEIARSEAKHFLVLFRDAGCQFRALYSYCPDTEQVTKLYGTGPKNVNDRMFDKFFKYNSGSKCFSQVHTKHLTVTIDAFTIHNSLWQGKKVQLPSKKDMALVI